MSPIFQTAPSPPEPWLRGTLANVPAVPRAVLHALELAKEDIERWCAGLTGEELQTRPSGLPPVAFHLRHIARSLDRLLTYAEGRQLASAQLEALHAELDAPVSRSELFAELAHALDHAAARIRALASSDLSELRAVGQKRLPSTLGGLLVHVADHTQRHVGQSITTAKIIVAARTGGPPE